MVRVDEGGWMLARDLARPSQAPVPAEVVAPGERWIDVDSLAQTLVAYEGSRPVYATLVSTGRGPAGGPSATPPGVHRVWVKIFSSDMANVQTQDNDPHYSMEDVPYEQFFDDAVALHGTYWHGDFGRPRSHGCVNLSPLDARWLFNFTEPRMPMGWAAVYPASIDQGSVVRVR
jgi:lipoprotein-anchoring transpeptidase ErfK/SrfK